MSRLDSPIREGGTVVRVLKPNYSQSRPMAAWCLGAMLVATPSAFSLQDGAGLDEATHLFYNARYREAAEKAAAVHPAEPDEELARDEIWSTALLFQLRRLLEPPDRKSGESPRSVDRCASCADLVTAFTTTIAHGQQLARKRIQANPNDETALFFLGKLDLNYVWLQLGTLHRKTGWSEYWEARRSLDAVLKVHPDHTRARVARAWIDYIVDTRISWGMRWMLGGGDKKKALAALHDVAEDDGHFFAHAEAVFALWDMLVREKRVVEAIEVAERLAVMFPANPEVATFLEAKRR